LKLLFFQKFAPSHWMNWICHCHLNGLLCMFIINCLLCYNYIFLYLINYACYIDLVIDSQILVLITRTYMQTVCTFKLMLASIDRNNVVQLQYVVSTCMVLWTKSIPCIVEFKASTNRNLIYKLKHEI